MTKEQLLARREQAETAFNSFAEQRDTKQTELNNIETELTRLQGEYRLLTEQIEAIESNSKSSKSKVSPVANVINVDEGAQK